MAHIEHNLGVDLRVSVNAIIQCQQEVVRISSANNPHTVQMEPTLAMEYGTLANIGYG